MADLRHTFHELLDLARNVMAGFDARERRPWTIEVALVELMKQVSDLSKHVMVTERYYFADRDADPRYATTRDELADELADILLAVIRIADHYEVDLEQAHIQARQRELEYLQRRDADTQTRGDIEQPPGRSGG